MAQPVKIALKLLDCRDAHKAMFGDTFHAVIKDYQVEIQRIATAKKASILDTALAMAQKLEEGGHHRAVPLFIAAAVELIDPSQA